MTTEAEPVPPRIDCIPATEAPCLAVERRRGRVESPDPPKRHPEDLWDEPRGAR